MKSIAFILGGISIITVAIMYGVTAIAAEDAAVRGAYTAAFWSALAVGYIFASRPWRRG